jgi:hypothetical protein
MHWELDVNHERFLRFLFSCRGAIVLSGIEDIRCIKCRELIQMVVGHDTLPLFYDDFVNLCEDFARGSEFGFCTTLPSPRTLPTLHVETSLGTESVQKTPGISESQIRSYDGAVLMNSIVGRLENA